MHIGATSTNFNALTGKTWKYLMIILRYFIKFNS